MPFNKSFGRFGKKQASSTNGKKNSAGKKVAGNAKSSAGKAAPVKSGKKRPKSTPAFSSLKSKQMTVERLKRTIWASLQKINDAIIDNATRGNLAAAKELFDFAGVYSLPMPDDENGSSLAAPTAVPATESGSAEPAMVHPIDLFFKNIGVEPSCKEPEPEAA